MIAWLKNNRKTSYKGKLEITKDKEVLLFHEYAYLYLGKNQHDKTVIFSLMNDEFAYEDSLFYLTLILNKKQLNHFKDSQFGFIDLLKDAPVIYVVETNNDNKLKAIFEYDFSEIPTDDLPETNFKYGQIIHTVSIN